MSPEVCRFSDAGMVGLSTRSSGRRPKSAKARNRGMWAAAVPRVLWGFGHELRCACDDAKRQRDPFCHVGGSTIEQQGILSDEILGFFFVIAQQSGVARQAAALSGKSHHRR